MRAVVAIAAALAAPACLKVPDGPAAECEVTTDCDTAHGEVCEEGVCWGNPPPGPFAAVLSPPGERKNDLAPRELALAAIPDDGYLGDLALERPASYTGTVRAICPPPSTECEETQLGASIIVSRPSAFAGGPGFRQVVHSDPATGAFALSLPATRPDDPAYTVTIVPDGRDDEPSSVTTAQLVPPLRTELRVGETTTGNVLELGAFTLPTIEGKLVDALGNGLDRYRVVAFGRWDASSPPTEVSTIDYTGADGTFALRLSQGLIEGSTIEIVARPYGDPLRPTLHLNVAASLDPILDRTLAAPDIGRKIRVPITIKGSAPGGEVAGVIGAQVTVTGVLPAAQFGKTAVSLVAEGVTDKNGMVELELADGAIASSYRIAVVPPANAPVGAVFDQPLALDATELRLPNRIAVAGKVLTVDGTPLGDVQVTVRPSLRFQWSLDVAPQAFLASIPAATAVTPNTGEFVVFVDPLIHDPSGDVFGSYDLAFEPTSTSNAPTYAALDLEIPRDTTQSRVQVPEVRLPDAAHIHGRVTDPDGVVIEGAELKVFQTSPIGAELCEAVPHAPASCPIPASLLGRGASDGAGLVRLTLPR